MMDYFGPVQTLLRSLFGWSSVEDYWFPNIRSLWGDSDVNSCPLSLRLSVSKGRFFRTICLHGGGKLLPGM
jgi:hypothetical protein